MVEWLLVSEI